ncbi:MAG: hypothetical protein ACFFEU_03665 [Candidatus Thorarchaeota archaeon]
MFERNSEENGAGAKFTPKKTSSVIDVLSRFDLTVEDIQNASQVLDFVQYLLDDDANMTKSFGLNKAARNQLEARIKEVFEGRLAVEVENLD